MSGSAFAPSDRPSIRAVLPDGGELVPGKGPGTVPDRLCAGPDQWGRCPVMLAGRELPCRGAVWHRQDLSPARAWSITFTPDGDVLREGICPVAILEPIGGLVHQAEAVIRAAP